MDAERLHDLIMSELTRFQASPPVSVEESRMIEAIKLLIDDRINLAMGRN